jgi:formate/nitrite transporter FocA (FNT family)
MLRSILDKIFNGILAGVLISIGGTVYLSVGSYPGAILFSVALLCICYKGYSLFTGKIGYVTMSRTKEDISVLLLGLFGNLIGTFLFGVLISYATSGIGEKAYVICLPKLELNALAVLVKSFLCGVLMYLAVSIFKENNKSIVGIVFCIPVFILCGFEHSIADMFYFACSGIVSFEAFIFIILVIIGNSLGSIFFSGLRLLTEKKKDE